MSQIVCEKETSVPVKMGHIIQSKIFFVSEYKIVADLSGAICSPTSLQRLSLILFRIDIKNALWEPSYILRNSAIYFIIISNGM